MNSIKYPYTSMQLHMLSKKCAVWLLEIFGKIYQTHNQYPLIVETSSDCINAYKFPSLGYEITDRHLLRSFVTYKKPDTNVLCDSIHCDQSRDSSSGIVLACGHGYHNYCLQRYRFKCYICLEYLQNEVKKKMLMQ